VPSRLRQVFSLQATADNIRDINTSAASADDS
jgi:hypothetical protein